jgi:MoxR-like ATPase
MGVKSVLKKKGPQATGIGKAQPLVDEVRGYFNWLGSRFVDREGEMQAILLALLSRQHVYLEGGPGTAKTAMAEALFSGITGANTFLTGCTKESREEQFIGGVNLKVVREEGHVEHVVTDRTIIRADLAFLDEFPDLPDMTMRSLLSILNERRFVRPWQQLDANLHTAIAAANYARLTDMTEAVYDRFLIRVKVSDIGKKEDRLRMYDMALQSAKVRNTGKGKLRFSTIQRLAKAVTGPSFITIPNDVRSLYDDLVMAYCKRSSKRISDRRRVQVLDFLKADALLNGNREVSYKNLQVAKFGLIVVNDAEQETKFDEALSHVTSTIRKRIEYTEQLQAVKDFFSKTNTVYEAREEAGDEERLALAKDLKRAMVAFKNRSPIQEKEFADMEEEFQDLNQKTVEMFDTVKSELDLD